MEREYSLLTGALKVFNDFSGGNESCEFTYDFNAPGFSELLLKYPIRETAGNGNELEKALNLLCWCSENVLHNGEKDVEFLPKTSLDILKYSYKKGREFGVYCRLQAIVFTECCLAMRIKARLLHCLPFSPYDFESHVVSILYIPCLHKWIMLDAGNNRYFTDEKGVILSPIEARDRLADGAFIKCNAEDESYKRYMAKNLFYFKSPLHNTFGADLQPNQKTIYCAPNGFNVLKEKLHIADTQSKTALPHSLPTGKGRSMNMQKGQL